MFAPSIHARRVLGLLCLAGCGGGSHELSSDDDFFAIDDGMEHGAETGDPHRVRRMLGVTPPSAPWNEMNETDREMYMIGKVLPIAQEIFAEFDARRYADFGCETCHGADCRERHFEMPTPSLPRVPIPGTPAYNEARAGDPEFFEFMERSVTETNRTLLGLAAFDPATGVGFGCPSCHLPPGALLGDPIDSGH